MQWRFALKYLVSPKSHSVINIIATVSLLAVVVPVAAMVVLLSVFNGFESLVSDLYKVVDADVEITTEAGFDVSDAELRRRIEQSRGVEAISYVVERQAMLSYRDNRTTVQLRGVDENYKRVVPIEAYTTRGNSEVQLGELDRLMLGEGVAYELGIYSMAMGDVEVFSLGGGSIGSIMPVVTMSREKLDLCGIFLIDQQHAASFALTSLRAASRIFNREQADKVLVKIADGVSHRKVAAELKKSLGDGYEVVLREEKNDSFYAIMRYEKWAIFFVSLLVLIIASLSIIGTVVILIIEKRNEQKTLLSIGADYGFIRGIFVREGLLISGVGGVVGLVIGVLVTLAQQHYGLVKMPNGTFLIENYPVELQAMDLVLIFMVFVAVALVVSLLATSTMMKRR